MSKQNWNRLKSMKVTRSFFIKEIEQTELISKMHRTV